jgi:chromosomal replication initiation ATPase DnaA
MSNVASRDPDAIVAALSVRGLLDLVDAVCAARGVTRRELCGTIKTRAVAAARQELWWLIRNHPERCYSVLEIARIVRRHHTTVAHGIAAHRQRTSGGLNALSYRDQSAIK